MRRTLGSVVLLVLVVLGAAYVTAARRTAGPPLDPGSTAPDGAKAVVELVRAFAGRSSVIDGVPADDVDTALLLRDRFERDEARRLGSWVRAGGTLVVADPGSALTPPVTGAATGVVTGDCAVGALDAVRSLAVGDGRRYEVPNDGVGCFAGPSGAVVVSQPLGAGTVVSVGGADVFTNLLLDEEDNAVLAVSLLAPTSTTSFGFIRSAAVGTGEKTLTDLVSDPVRSALAQVLVAFLVVALWRGRRLGRPVTETQPVAVESSELTRAVGRLLARRGSAARAAAVLRDRARRELSGPLGLPLDAGAEVVVSVLAQRTSLCEAEATRAVASPVTTDDDLVDVANLLVRIRQEVSHGRQPNRSEPTPV